MLRRAVLQASTRRRRLFSPSPSPSPSYSLSARKCSSSPSSQIPHSHSVEQSEDTLQLPPSATVSIDRSNLYHPPEHSHEPSDDSELVKLLKNVIKEVLTNPKAGFYINRDVFGAEGDFITSPEVSQMFGEMVGVWAVCLWEQMGQPDRINLVELGPGRGTLMADLLRGVSKFKNFTASLQLHLVECSPALQKLQYQNLKCTREDAADGDCISMLSGSPVSWHAMLEQVPTGVPTIIIAHEFYDALPVHQFQKKSLETSNDRRYSISGDAMWSALRGGALSSSHSAVAHRWKNVASSHAILSRDFSSSFEKNKELLSLPEVEKILEDVRADDVKVITAPKGSEFADYMVIATGRSPWHVRNISQALIYKVKQKQQGAKRMLLPSVVGQEGGKWIVIDSGKLIVHAVDEKARAYYNFEGLWTAKTPNAEDSQDLDKAFVKVRPKNNSKKRQQVCT
ncbi:NADH dehydrogenase ubiquinone complex I [Perilla frutescens var. hirtella]|nr:NADH dehydrogenase ubiquinone complex I [Perilla frutescens var. hirtella]